MGVAVKSITSERFMRSDMSAATYRRLGALTKRRERLYFGET
jgi:hypothetical protein